ncbi:PAS domain S-box protein [bacterium]|nr:PAS domain S-box protein [bacterium]
MEKSDDSIGEVAFDQVLDLIIQIAAGNLEINRSIPETDGKTEAIIIGLNMLAETLKSKIDTLTATENYLNCIIDSMAESLFVADSNGIIKKTNRSACDMLGLPEQELLGKSLNSFLPQEDLIFAHTKKSKKRQGDFKHKKSFDSLLCSKNGTEIPVLISGTPLRNQEMTSGDLVYLARDMTEHKSLITRLEEYRSSLENLVAKRTDELNVIIRELRKEILFRKEVEKKVKKSESKLKRSENLYRTLIESADDVIILMDMKNNHLIVNKAYHTTLGHEDFSSIHDYNALIHPQDRDKLNEALSVLLKKGKFDFEYRIRHRNGRWITRMAKYILIHDDSEKPESILVINRDITERKQAEEALEREVQKRTAELVKINKQLKSEIHKREQIEKERQQLWEQIERQRVLSMRSDRLRSLGEMAAGIAHELNQPLVGVRGLAEHILISIQRNWPLTDDRLLEKLNLIIEQSDRMTNIIEHVRRFSREAGKQETYPVDVNEVINATLNLVNTQFEAHGLSLRKDLQGGLPHILANPFSLEEVILNIINNARDAVEEQMKHDIAVSPEVIIRSFFLDDNHLDQVGIQVIDFGIGIAEKDLKKVFDPFYTSKGPEKGTGLGLSICKTIVEDFHGTLTIDSTAGKGTTVTVLFPAQQHTHSNE